MKFYHLIHSIRIVLMALVSISCQPKKETADLIIFGGHIYTVEESMSIAEAVAVRGDSIIFVGTRADAQAFVDDGTEQLDLKGKTMTPGFIEGHGHIMDVGYQEMNVDLAGLSTFEEVIEKVKASAALKEKGAWILGKGWHQEKWVQPPNKMVKGFPVHDQLSAAVPDHPVYLEHASGHAVLVNKKAMEMAGLLPLAREGRADMKVDGGEVVLDDNGLPTGILNENALNLVYTIIPPQDDSLALELAMRACLRNGLTSFHDAGATRKSIALFKDFHARNQLLIGMYVMITGFDRNLVHEYLRLGPDIDPHGNLTIRSIKLNCDGALGSRGAWLLEPYADQPQTNGMATLSMDTVLSTSRSALKAGFQVCSHAIGDKANHEILNRYETAFKEDQGSARDHRFRIEHAQHLHPDDIPRFGRLGVIPAMQAIHMSSDRPWAIERLGEQRIVEGAYMWQSLLSSGARIVNGTDAPVEPLNPIACFFASVTRRTLSGTPPDGYEPKEKMTRAQALRSYTLDAAFGAFEENIKGSIMAGKRADFTIFSDDIMTIPEENLLSTKIAMTIVGGRVRYRAE